VRRLVSSAFCVLALLVPPAAEAARGAPHRPDPAKLWRNFPLQTERLNREAPARVGSPAGDDERAVANAVDEKGGGLVMTILTAATLLAGVLLVLILMVRELGFAHLFPRRARRLAADLYAGHSTFPSLRTRTSPEAGDPDADRGQGRTATNDADESTSRSSRTTREVGAPPRKPAVARALKDTIDPYLDPGKSRETGQATSENGPLKPTSHSETPADDALEILKAKLGKPVAQVDDRREVEVETLKIKLGREIARKDKIAAGNLSKTKLARRGSLKALSTESVEPTEATLTSKGSAAPSGSTAAGAPQRLLSLEQHSVSKCQIVWSRGYLKSLFRAVARTATGDVSVIAESPRFRWKKADPPQQTTQAVQAHRILLEVLERDGWSIAGRGQHWYMLELERQKRRRRGASGDERPRSR
jgi:hypothetical protein